MIDHFGVIAPFYDKVLPARESEKFSEHAKLPVEGPLLDVGGGTGRVSQMLRKLAKNIIVADLSTKMLREAKKKDGLLAVCSLSEKLPFPDEYFERVIMVDALHHVYDHVDTAAELWRVVKPGGRIVIEEPDIRKFIIKLLAVVEKLILMRSHFMTPERIAELFKSPNAESWIVSDGYNTRIMIEKLPND